ncbi:hypothetical protein AAG570_003077 [Ranatra chinensis]|uniref:Uncharacterized protein n=1 Tax=Ranatra chinensis TaxID=642074 RepID=A0ABD0Y5R0_9HEMI
MGAGVGEKWRGGMRDAIGFSRQPSGPSATPCERPGGGGTGAHSSGERTNPPQSTSNLRCLSVGTWSASLTLEFKLHNEHPDTRRRLRGSCPARRSQFLADGQRQKRSSSPHSEDIRLPSEMLTMSTLMMPAATVTTMTNPAPIPVAQPVKIEPKFVLNHNAGIINKAGKLAFEHYAVTICLYQNFHQYSIN